MLFLTQMAKHCYFALFFAKSCNLVLFFTLFPTMQIWFVLQELGLDNLGGIFVVTFAGVALASIACIVELLCVTYQDSAELGTTWWYEIRSGLNICWNIWFFCWPLSGHGQVLRSVVLLLVARRGCLRSRSCEGGTFQPVLMLSFCVGVRLKNGFKWWRTLIERFLLNTKY